MNDISVRRKDRTIGHGSHCYRVIKSWGDLDTITFPVADCHEMVLDRKGRIFLLTNHTKNNVLIYDNSGQLLGHWGDCYPGAHGLSLFDENGEEFLFITDIERHQVIKTTLDGKIIQIIDYPKEIDEYSSADQFKPTETVIAPNGDIYVTDGYGLQFVIQYDKEGNYIRHWGGKGNKQDQFDCAHGIAIDNRDTERPTLLITSRNHNAFKRFSMDGKYLATISLPGSFVCRPVIKGDLLYAAVFRSGNNMNVGSGYITILDRHDCVVATPGGSAPAYIQDKLQEQHQTEKDIFIHPHDVCIDEDENIIVCQWKAGNSYPMMLQRVP